MSVKGLLLINLGTPDEPTTPAVRRYLRQFLSDPKVIDINPVARAIILNLFILPTRPRKSAEAYQQIWTERGSPLLFHSEDLLGKVRERLGDGWRIELGMRYGNPSIPDALERFRQASITDIVVFPLYPQYATSSVGTALDAVYGDAQKHWDLPYFTVVPPFYEHPGFIEAVAAVGQRELDEFKPDHVLFSFHGLPEHHMKKSDPTGAHCLVQPGCCDSIGDANRGCYRAQCYATSRALASALNLTADNHSVAFQSRLGRRPWIKPYTDVALEELAGAGVKRLAVFCPAFVADCLETLEEIGIRADEDFRAAGGDALRLVPCVNSSDLWADAVVRMAEARGAIAS